METKKTVDSYIAAAGQWREVLVKLRKILNGAGLEETIKWGSPCYTHAGKNVVGLAAFKSYAGLWFFQGSLLQDPDDVLINAQSGKTKAMRQWRFDPDQPIKVKQVKTYVAEAMQLAEAGTEIKPERNKPVALPPELQKALAKNKKTRSAFDGLSLGKRREYADYIASAKRQDTRNKRLEKILPLIAAGAGLNDKYRAC